MKEPEFKKRLTSCAVNGHYHQTRQAMGYAIISGATLSSTPFVHELMSPFLGIGNSLVAREQACDSS